ncbi:MAG: glycosyltransferase family 1 protein [Ignavibacteria bacterium]|nr:glycosyltransferase family 1 protein [Ignavibacteria bacterium]
MTRPIFTFKVDPALPPELERLREIAYNLVWVWDVELIALFMRLDLDLWEETRHNPVRMLGMIKQERLNTLARDDAFLAQLERAWERFKDYVDNAKTWYAKNHSIEASPLVAYCSAEFGLTECIPNYSGGLGVLSGDHLKSASDLGIPLVGVGLLYQQGYFRQYLNADGWQQERYPENDFFVMPLTLERDHKGAPVKIQVDLPGRKVTAQVWGVRVGRIRLFLLDTNIPENSKDDQNITDQLYGGDGEMRIMQETLLGIGGYRALKALGISPPVYHLNEGHSAFLVLERARDLMSQHKLSFAEAREIISAGTVFTTHTPVPAGNDYFPPELMEKYFSSLYKLLGLSRKDFLGLGRRNPEDETEHFCMTILALKMSGHSNGVSKLHATVSRGMWRDVWPGIPTNEVPITSITNGTHGPSWISRDMVGLFDRYLGPRWIEDPGDYATWGRVHHIPDEELWRTHERRRERLVAYARHRLHEQLVARGAPPSEVKQAREILDSEALTIGFGRRFATYKRATLMLRDPERLLRILTNKDRPVQIIFAGKAHPRDNAGKELIRQIVHFERNPEIRRRMVFLEDYDMVVARYMVQGVDVWLNTPRRPLEASGTSGMKAAFNGALNLSILDGWWVEAYNVHTGWAIGKGEEYDEEAYQDEVEANAFYDLLEKDVVPLFYDRGADGLPRGWISKMKTSMRSICPVFNTNRMVREYTEAFYLPSAERFGLMSSDQMKRAKQLAEWKKRIHQKWGDLRIVDVKTETKDGLRVGEDLVVRVKLRMGQLGADDLAVELVHGILDAKGDIVNQEITPLTFSGSPQGEMGEFTCTLPMTTSGRHGFSVRVLPRHADLDEPRKEGLILWPQRTEA